MEKIYLSEQLEELKKYPVEVINSISQTVDTLEENYGIRDVEKDLGGYVLIVENLGEVKKLKEDKLQGLVAEYTDVIECSEGANWTSSLFLISNDFSIVVVTKEELSKDLVE
ncbi:MAG: hypothetical protein ACLSXJ_09805 [Clostridium saudiense]|uniref:hypothetical protein n=1 Tax=Clostridium saudiense TaxID=1414720 RepID=UPI0039946F4A